MKKILTSDLLITDIIVKLDDAPQLQDIINKYDLQKGGKVAITKEQCEEFFRAVRDRPYTVTPGGSSANVLTTLSKLIGNRVGVEFLGVVGDGMHRGQILDSLHAANITLMPPEEHLSKDVMREGATSFVITFPDGARTIATYQGNARELLKPEMIDDAMIERNNILFMQGSLWQKMDEAFANKLMTLRQGHNKELWLALPTHAKFGEENSERFKFLLPSASIILANDEELARIYKTDDRDNALKLLQQDIENSKSAPNHQLAFITRGDQGAVLVTKKGNINEKGIKHYPITPRNDGIKNTLGAGDTAFAGFLTGHLLNMSPDDSVRLAMTLAAAKLREEGPRLADPLSTLRKDFPGLVSMLDRLPHREEVYNGGRY